MKKWTRLLACAALTMALALVVSCDWSSGGSEDGFNTSEGAGVNVNVSGVYHGQLSGGRAVEQSSGPGAVIMLTISQGGNRVDVTDNQGSTYQGTVGSPGAVAQPNNSGTYSAGQELVQYQINFSGQDNVAQRNIEFVGIIHLISVTDIQGHGRESETELGVDDTTTTTYTEEDGIETNIVTVTVIVAGPVTTTTTVTQDADTGVELERIVEETFTDTTTITGTREFEITEANSQLRLEGTWVEEGGFASRVDAISSGAGGTIVVEEAAAAPAP